jgi:hypothetical protein
MIHYHHHASWSVDMEHGAWSIEIVTITITIIMAMWIIMDHGYEIFLRYEITASRLK